jgi:hypothetical protein
LQSALFAECVKAVIQSECYLYPQRGFEDTRSYQAHWDISHPNSCRYYSHLDLVARRWFGYIGEEPRTRNLFHRHKNVAVWQGADLLQATGSFLDSFHELGIQVQCDSEGRIFVINGGFLRAPDSICFDTTDALARFVGCDLQGMTRKELVQRIGGQEGCVHLLDLVQDVLAGLQEAMNLFDSAKA